VCRYLRPAGRLVVVEYETAHLPFVPYPVGFRRFGALCAEIGRDAPVQVGVRRSPRTDVSMYAAVS
jgi:hypothetical protein